VFAVLPLTLEAAFELIRRGLDGISDRGCLVSLQHPRMGTPVGQSVAGLTLDVEQMPRG
jgi:hypothetical protein